MQDLRLVAANDAGSHLLLRSLRGEEFRLPIDERLRAATRGDRARLGQLEIEMESQLRPRDIQARIRAGESADAVAHSAGVPVERVRRFEGPVLAERAHMAQMAQRASARRAGHPEGPSAVLGQAVAGRLDPLGVRDEALDWDSWRRDDGRWTVVLSYVADRSPYTAHFVYDPRARTTVPDDDEARWLIGDLAERPRPAQFVPRLASALAEPDLEGAGDEPAEPVERLAKRERERPETGEVPRRERERPRRVSAMDILVPPSAAVARPSRPTRPDGPAQPGHPGQPERPAQPDRRAQPGRPAQPAQPGRPAQPAQPERPAHPAARLHPPSLEQARHPAFLARRDPAPQHATGQQLQPRPPGQSGQPHSEHPQSRQQQPGQPEPEQQPPAATVTPHVIPREERLTGTTDAGPDRSVERSAPRAVGRNRRASVPSWDEILFGTRRRGE
jgi:Protein of unknown function (DUF3071)